MFGHELRTPVDLVFGPLLEPEIRGEPGLEYYYYLVERLRKVPELARRSLTKAGMQQKRAYDHCCKSQDFAPGAQVWVYSPVRKRGYSPKLTSHWMGPCTVLEKLSDVVYRVRLHHRNRVVVLHRDRLAPYQPRATAAERLEEDNQPSPMGPSPSGRRTPQHPARRRRLLPQRLRDFVVDSWTAGDS